jgi:hypothetical protein
MNGAAVAGPTPINSTRWIDFRGVRPGSRPDRERFLIVP